jgi:PAS domain S-box-containing protein
MHMKIMPRLSLGFLIVICCSLIIGLYALSINRSAYNTARMLYNHPFAVSNAVRDIETRIIRMHRTMKDVVLTTDQTALQDLRKEINADESVVLTDFALVRERFLGDKKLVQQAQQLFVDWRQIRARVFDLRLQGKFTEAAAITQGEGRSHIETMLASIHSMVEFAAGKAEELFADGIHTSHQHYQQTLYLLIITCILGVFIAFYISLTIVRPVFKMKDVAEHVKQGNVHARTRLQLNDELGQLARSYDSMLDTIEGFNETLESTVRQRTEELEQEVADRRAAEEALQKSLQREHILADLIRQAPLGIATGLLNGSTITLNKAFADLVEYSLEELTSMNWQQDLTPEKWKEQELESLHSITQENPSVQYEKEYITKSGRLVPVELFATASFSDDGAINYYLAFIFDITERKKMDEELSRYRNHLEEEIEQRTRELKAKNEDLERFTNLFIGREFRIKELSQKLTQAEEELASCREMLKKEN